MVTELVLISVLAVKRQQCDRIQLYLFLPSLCLFYFSLSLSRYENTNPSLRCCCSVIVARRRLCLQVRAEDSPSSSLITCRRPAAGWRPTRSLHTAHTHTHYKSTRVWIWYTPLRLDSLWFHRFRHLLRMRSVCYLYLTLPLVGYYLSQVQFKFSLCVLLSPFFSPLLSAVRSSCEICPIFRFSLVESTWLWNMFQNSVRICCSTIASSY